MSMQYDFIHPRQLDDMKAIRAAIRSFDKDMTRMMLLMKDLGTTLEHVSSSFDALTSLSFTSDKVKKYVHHFSEEIVQMKQGVAFRNYNKLVHEEVLLPVAQLKVSLKDADMAAKAEKRAFDEYIEAKRRVDKKEKSFAEKSKALSTSNTYPKSVRARDEALAKLQRLKNQFEEKFVTLVNRVETVAATALKRYLNLNGVYMSSVVDALTKTEPTVEEAVDLYRQEQRQLRQSAIQQRCAQMNTGSNACSASNEYRLDPNQMNGSLRNSVRYSASLRTFRTSCTPATEASPGRVSKPERLSQGTSKPTTEAASAAKMSPSAQHDSTHPRDATNSTPDLTPPPVNNASFSSPSLEEIPEDEDFGSVSQVGTAGKVGPPLNFGRGTESQVSSTPPQNGYLAAHNAALASNFLARMEAKSITASEVCAPHPREN
ncbi:hypothetical protein JKF63_03816 [Porcisia hertigi]|uniref:BAR domain-containing protein n=1 Tax=Porcisia hertigi TaxID=2761500 RepID=A0A836I3J1_9TRYP|nr:hypothetical protein JKF63_03816 [Porcisia hertigi]